MSVSYDVDATLMLFWRHQSGIHVVNLRPGRVPGGVIGTDVAAVTRRAVPLPLKIIGRYLINIR